MEILHRYYASLKVAVHHLDNVKQLHKRQKEAYDIIQERLQNTSFNNEERLVEYETATRQEKKSWIKWLLLLFVCDNAIVWGVAFLLEIYFSLGIPVFMPFMVALPIFLLAHPKIVQSAYLANNSVKEMENVKVLLGEKKQYVTLIELLKELESTIGENGVYIEELESAIDEYMSLLIDFEKKLAPAGTLTVEMDDDFKPLEEGLKKLSLAYKEETKNETN